MAKLVTELQSFVAPARRTRGWTQQRLARAAGVSRQTVVELERGNYNPSTALALRLAVLLDASVEELFRLGESELTGLLAKRTAQAV